MASTQGQFAVLCHLCPNPVEHHCNLCDVDLCSSCIATHMADKTKQHEVVDFINRKKGRILPGCSSHKGNRCEMYCKDCHEPTCVLCVTTTHKKHDFTDIGEIIENIKQQITNDLTELENDIAPAYRKVAATVPSGEFDKILAVIQDHEDKICNVVRKIGSQIREEVSRQKGESELKDKEIQSFAANTEKELNRVIQHNKSVLKSSEVTAIMSYTSINEKLRYQCHEFGFSCPTFLPGMIQEEQILAMFGELQMQDSIMTPCLLGDLRNLEISWGVSRQEMPMPPMPMPPMPPFPYAGYQPISTYGNFNFSPGYLDIPRIMPLNPGEGYQPISSYGNANFSPGSRGMHPSPRKGYQPISITGSLDNPPQFLDKGFPYKPPRESY
eukprot:XP_011439340.1 PREDICTED: E3 ubiquitin-protein ligase TRIM36-like [Crassostrea gigas]